MKETILYNDEDDFWATLTLGRSEFTQESMREKEVAIRGRCFQEG